MALTNDSVAVTPGTGATIATHLAGGKEHQAMVQVDEGGHIIGTRSVYRFYVTSQAVGANKVFWDIFNGAGSGVTLRVIRARMFPNLSAAVTGTLGIEVFLTRTTSVGTAGTAATADGVSLTASTISRLDLGSSALPPQVTARFAPTGGAAAGAVVGYGSVFTEETNAGSAVGAALGVDLLQDSGYDITIPEGNGLRGVQGAVASVGNVVFVIDLIAV
jgi:hypothetical protein